MDILVNRTLYMSCQAGPGIEPGPSALKASALPIELTWQTKYSFREKRLFILASCMANLSKFHVVFSSNTLVRLDKDAFEGHLCQTVNNFVKQKSNLLSPLRKRCPPQHISISETLEYLEYLLKK